MNNHHHKREPKNLSIHLHTATPDKYEQGNHGTFARRQKFLLTCLHCATVSSPNPGSHFLAPIVLSILSPGILKVVLNLASRPPPKEQFSWHAQPSKKSYGHKKCLPLELTTKTNNNQAWLLCPSINVLGALQTGIKKEGNPTMGWHQKIRASYEPTFALHSIPMPVLIKTMSALHKILNCSYCPKHLFQLNNEVHTLEQPWALPQV
jgi:hypothetical protein